MSQPNNPYYPPGTPRPNPTNIPQPNPATMAQPDPQNPSQYYPPNAPQPYPPNMPQSYPPNMPRPRNMTNSSWFSTRLMRIFLIIFGVMVLIVIPLMTYFIGTLIGIHMSSNDIDQGYSYGGLLYTVYNATHNPVYYQESQISQAQGIAEGQSDVGTLQLIGLGIGFVADVAIGFLIVREYERMG